MIKVASDIKKIKADRLISITSVKEGDENTLFYHFSLNKKPEIKEFSVKVPKGEKVETIVNLYPIATLLEAEVTELFGIKFQGNEMSGMRLFQGEGKPVPKTCSVKESFRVTKDA
jgi:NADH:ubiquinone oxidoreductase subunit C